MHVCACVYQLHVRAYILFCEAMLLFTQIVDDVMTAALRDISEYMSEAAVFRVKRCRLVMFFVMQANSITAKMRSYMWIFVIIVSMLNMCIMLTAKWKLHTTYCVISICFFRKNTKILNCWQRGLYSCTEKFVHSHKIKELYYIFSQAFSFDDFTMLQLLSMTCWKSLGTCWHLQVRAVAV